MADEAGLVYLLPSSPGFRRVKRGKGFSYFDASGKAIKDPDLLFRIKKLVIPPAWTDVWISPRDDSHIQAAGLDARGRKQYLYHARWREFSNDTKFSHLIDFGTILPSLRRRIDQGLAATSLLKERVLSAVVDLLDRTMIRIGNRRYALQNKAYGLTTLTNDHVRVTGSQIEFEFTGKSGKQFRIRIRDRRLARIVQACEEIPGQDLFQYYDDEGNSHPVRSQDVNDFLKGLVRRQFTAKHFRTWKGTAIALSRVFDFLKEDGGVPLKKRIIQALDEASRCLNNTRAVCRQYYVDPRVFEMYQSGVLEQCRKHCRFANRKWLSAMESRLLHLLRGAHATALSKAA